MARNKDERERAEEDRVEPALAPESAPREAAEPTSVPEEQRAENQTAELTEEQQEEADRLQENTRVDASGRALNPWEVSPEDQTFAVVPDESDEKRKARELQAEHVEEVEAANAGQTVVQGASTPAGTGTAAGGPATTGGTAPGTTGA